MGIPILEAQERLLVSSIVIKATAFNKHFSTVFVKEDLGIWPTYDDRQFTSDIINIVFDEVNIERKLQCLRFHKSPGSDQLHPQMLKELT